MHILSRLPVPRTWDPVMVRRHAQTFIALSARGEKRSGLPTSAYVFMCVGWACMANACPLYRGKFEGTKVNDEWWFLTLATCNRGNVHGEKFEFRLVGGSSGSSCVCLRLFSDFWLWELFDLGTFHPQIFRLGIFPRDEKGGRRWKLYLDVEDVKVGLTLSLPPSKEIVAHVHNPSFKRSKF